MVLPNLNDLFKECHCICCLAGVQEKLAHVEITLAQEDRLGAVLTAFLVDTLSELFESFFITIRSILSHEKATKCNVQSCMVTIKFFLCDHGVFTACTAIVSTIFPTFEQVPIGSNQEFFSFLQFGSSHSDVSLSQDEVCWEQLNRFLVKCLVLDRITHGVIDNSVGFIVLFLDDAFLGLVDGHFDGLNLKENKNDQS